MLIVLLISYIFSYEYSLISNLDFVSKSSYQSQGL